MQMLDRLAICLKGAINMKMPFYLIICVAIFDQVNARTMTEIEREISELHNEYVRLRQNPIFVWGSKQKNPSEKQKGATSACNINMARGEERKSYKTKRVVALNPGHVCPIHKVIYVGDRCPASPGCKSGTGIGTGNFCNLGPECDLSYKTWKALKEKMPEGEAREAGLKEIDKSISALREEQSEIKKQQGTSKTQKKSEPSKEPEDSDANADKATKAK